MDHAAVRRAGTAAAFALKCFAWLAAVASICAGIYWWDRRATVPETVGLAELGITVAGLAAAAMLAAFAYGVHLLAVISGQLEQRSKSSTTGNRANTG